MTPDPRPVVATLGVAILIATAIVGPSRQVGTAIRRNDTAAVATTLAAPKCPPVIAASSHSSELKTGGTMYVSKPRTATLAPKPSSRRPNSFIGLGCSSIQGAA